MESLPPLVLELIFEDFSAKELVDVCRVFSGLKWLLLKKLGVKDEWDVYRDLIRERATLHKIAELNCDGDYLGDCMGKCVECNNMILYHYEYTCFQCYYCGLEFSEVCVDCKDKVLCDCWGLFNLEIGICAEVHCIECAKEYVTKNIKEAEGKGYSRGEIEGALRCLFVKKISDST